MENGEKMRPDWNTYFMQFAELAATRSTCLRRQVGAVIVVDKQVVATGYNGPPRGISHCISQSDVYSDKCARCNGTGESGYTQILGVMSTNSIPKLDSIKCFWCHGKGYLTNESQLCIREAQNIASGERHELCFGLHAEQNCIIQAARHGISIRDSMMYCTFKPCIICLKMIINAGIKSIVFKEEYNDAMSQRIASEAGLKLIQYIPEER